MYIYIFRHNTTAHLTDYSSRNITFIFTGKPKNVRFPLYGDLRFTEVVSTEPAVSPRCEWIFLNLTGFFKKKQFIQIKSTVFGDISQNLKKKKDP